MGKQVASCSVQLEWVIDPEPGENAVYALASPSSVLFVRSEEAQTKTVYVSLYDGNTAVPYSGKSTGTDKDFGCSLALTGVIGTDGLQYSAAKDGDRMAVIFSLEAGKSVSKTVSVTLRHSQTTLTVRIPVETVTGGQQGDSGPRGPVLRGPQKWEDCEEGFLFQDGTGESEFLDVVIHDGMYSMCTKSHAKREDSYPRGATDLRNGLWKDATKFDIVATKILLAEHAWVDNLGVRSVEMKDHDGNVVFYAKDGDLVCKTGSFSDITVDRGTFNGITANDLTVNRGQFTEVSVDGNITAKTLDLKACLPDQTGWMKMNGSYALEISQLVLPALEKGSMRVFKIINPKTSRITPADLVLKPESGSVYVSASMNSADAQSKTLTIKEYGTQSGKYIELFGYYDMLKKGTVWLCNVYTTYDLTPISTFS